MKYPQSSFLPEPFHNKCPPRIIEMLSAISVRLKIFLFVRISFHSLSFFKNRITGKYHFFRSEASGTAISRSSAGYLSFLSS